MSSSLIYAGFTKEQIKVALDGLGNVKINGERQLKDNRWSRFQKEVPLPVDCDTQGIGAEFDDEILYLRFPKIITPVKPQAQSKPTWEESPIPKPPSEQKPPKDTKPDKPQEDTHIKATPISSADEQTKRSGDPTEANKAQNIAEKDKKDESADAWKDTAKKVEKQEKVKVPFDDAARRAKDGVSGGDLVMDQQRRQQLIMNIIGAVVVIVTLVMHVIYTRLSGRPNK